MTGGTEKYFRDLSTVLTEHGHETIPFALQHPDNPPTPYDEYFLPPIDYGVTSTKYRVKNTMRILGRTLYSWEARHYMDRLINDVHPDIAHLQSIEHHISPSIIHSLRKNGIPIVQSINTYKLVCGSYRLYHFREQQICQRCLYGKHYHAFLTRCVKDSRAASLLATMEMYLHDAMKIYGEVDRFIVPNSFLASHLIKAGYPEQKIVKLRNPLSLRDYTPSYQFEDYILYFGRIDPEKGVDTLVRAMQFLPRLCLVVVGDGQDREALEEWSKSNGVTNVNFVGPKWDAELQPYLSAARLVVVPSKWLEPSPYVIYQSFATGKPVVGARIGGIPELITPETGLLFEPDNVEDLVTTLESVAFDDEKLKIMGKAARRWAEENLDPQRYYEDIIHVYQTLLTGNIT